ncbi:Uncharacterized protein OS=Candidatus Entotheonella sp. TSY1 GN=ETSY1_21580 PE=4 SV=1 [Gemmataceae bacterium]|nr:Uncharacterized protein OS=Candidatus Entotheonella sp. TSY1 GN=ETSY1_21580 PE=4 SV=1 [Gemmataceae bacterium]VTT98995.1 Uncharacterized protein OS=Candidatus Entotheonella sp. TSY1 GN=ETSY1_21580 PE=4 SV=1 [Gemmataceae bacterium]
MSSPPGDGPKAPSEDALFASALAAVRKGVNPFAAQVAAVGTAEESLLGGVPEFAEAQLQELLDVVGAYRAGRPATQVFAVLGERGAGKTHLFYALRNELKRLAGERGEETLLVVVDRLSPGMDATDYLLWQIANHFLAQKGEGGRMLNVIAGRLTARLLGEALRQLAPHQKAELVPAGGFFSALGFGASKVQARIDAVEDVILQCDAKHPTAPQIRSAVEAAGIRPETAQDAVARHLDRTESNDVVGWLRKELYKRLSRVALLGDREPFEELHMGGFDDARANVKNAGNLGRRMLETWLELLAALGVPVVIAFDQLEDYVNAPDPDQTRLNQKFFTDATAKFVNELRNVCLLVFANESFWIGLINAAEPFVKERLTQPFTLPGRPARAHLTMPDAVPPDLIEKVVRCRLRLKFPDLDLTGLPPAFPFGGEDVTRLGRERTIRALLRGLAKRYDEIVYAPAVKPGTTPPPVPTAPNFRKRLEDLWREKVAAAARYLETEVTVGAAFIPEVQNALGGWLQALHQNQLTGAGPWQRVELVTDTALGAYGYLSVIRTEGRNAPGVGVAAWLGQKKGQPQDLRQRLEFFDANPCPIRTLVVLRAEGEAALNGGETKKVYDAARSKRRDIRVQGYEPRHLHALLAFSPWLQTATEELKAAEADPAAGSAFREYLGELSRELLGWVDQWRQPAPPKGVKS